MWFFARILRSLYRFPVVRKSETIGGRPAFRRDESKNAGGLQQNTSIYDSSSVAEQLQHLQEKKKRIQGSIDELLDAARKAGIEPGDLR